MSEKHGSSEKIENVKDAVVEVEDGDLGSGKSLLINASGHVDELKRQYGLLSICATALTIGKLPSSLSNVDDCHD
jgi:hypothetical protein